MRFGLQTRHGDADARLKHGPKPQLRERAVGAGTVERTSQRLEKGLLSLAVPTSPIQAFTGQIFTNDSITELL